MSINQIGQISRVPIEELRPHPANTHTHAKKQIAQIARSIGQFGFTTPIIIDEDHYILAGHGRWLAAKLLGLGRVPVIVLAGLSDAERRAYLLADNKLTENAGWDRARLAAELSTLGPLLSEAGLDIGLTGFEAPEIDGLSGDLVDSEVEALDEFTVAQEPVSRRSDVWQLGAHRLVCGDARDAASFRKVMAGERASMIFADPPYNVRIRSVQGRGRIRHREFLVGSGELSSAGYRTFLAQSLSLAARHSIDGAIHFVCTDWRHIADLIAAGNDVYDEMKNIIVWNKSNAGQGSFYRSQYELIGVFKSGQAPHLNNIELGRHGRNRSNIWTYSSGRMDDLALHPTVKPIALVADAMRDCSRRGDIVLDPFIGSGTTILAAERIGRRAYGIELDPLYVDVAVRRWQHYTKRDAVLVGSGQTFDDVAAARPAGSAAEHAP
jgi:DNA modification methylase